MEELIYVFELIHKNINKPCAIEFFSDASNIVTLRVRCKVKNNETYARQLEIPVIDMKSMTNPNQIIKNFCRQFNNAILDL